MKKYFLIIATVFSIAEVSSQNTNSLLWKISGNGLKRPSYLYGTMHSRDARAHEFGDSVMVKFNECDAVALELLTSEMKEDPFAMMQYILMKDTTLDMLLSQDDYEKVKKFASENLGIYSMMIDKLMPIFTSVLITEMNMGSDKEMTVDEFFETAGNDSGKILIGIESVEEQMKALSSISLQEQAQMLKDQIRSLKKDKAIFEKLMQYYQRQDLQGMMKLYADQELPEMFDHALVASRNHTMTTRIDSIIKQQTTFVAVGALHLPGDEGLISLMRKKGYEVHPVISGALGNKKR